MCRQMYLQESQMLNWKHNFQTKQPGFCCNGHDAPVLFHVIPDASQAKSMIQPVLFCCLSGIGKISHHRIFHGDHVVEIASADGKRNKPMFFTGNFLIGLNGIIQRICKIVHISKVEIDKALPNAPDNLNLICALCIGGTFAFKIASTLSSPV